MANPFSERKRKLDILKALRPGARKTAERSKFVTCTGCRADFDRAELERAQNVCPRCGKHMYIPVHLRLERLFDGGAYEELFAGIAPRDVIAFPGYAKKAAEAAARSGLTDACVCALGKLDGITVLCAAIDIAFMMGSMGTAVGEKITRAAELAQKSAAPLVIFCAGGGARMQEGVFSLMQMIKTASAVRRFSDAGGLLVSVITHPTTGGITASFASLGDIIIAEPGAMFGFAGPRVIEQTIGEKLPEGFQSAQFQLEHGFVDAIVPRSELRGTLSRLLRLHCGDGAKRGT